VANKNIGLNLIALKIKCPLQQDVWLGNFQKMFVSFRESSNIPSIVARHRRIPTEVVK
jgi:hypothetical protein